MATSSAGRARSQAARRADSDSAERLLTIGELAKQTQVSTRTIRYYEELGILPTPERSSGGTRRYPHDYVFYVEGARLLKDLGFGLEEIAELGQFAMSKGPASKRTRLILESKLSELEHRIRVLTRLHELVLEATAPRAANKSPRLPLLHRIGEGLEQPSAETKPRR
jgi:DNA-binding transcriptional MerR regulator